MANEPRQQPKIGDVPKHQQHRPELPAPGVMPPAVGVSGVTPRPVGPPPATTGKTTAQLVAHLLESGTPARKLECVKGMEDKPATDAFTVMEAQGVPEGTLDKAQLFIWGQIDRTRRLKLQTVDGEMVRLQQENESLRRQLAEAKAKCLGMEQANILAKEAERDALRKLSVLKMGRPAAELERLGIHETVLT